LCVSLRQLTIWPAKPAHPRSEDPDGALATLPKIQAERKPRDGRAADTLRASAAKETRDMATGTVKWFNTTKGFGFIQPEDGSKDVFVHVSAVERAGMRGLVEGQRVSFEVSMERGKPAAANLKAL